MRKEIWPSGAKGTNLLVRPLLIVRHQARFAFLIVSDPSPIAPVDIDLLECGLEVERGVRVVFREWDPESREPLT